MTIDEAYRLVQFIFNKEQNGNITPSQFNLIAERGQIAFINSRLSKEYDPKGNLHGWQSDQIVRRELSSILKLNETTGVAAGIAAYPDDYIDYDSMTTSDGYLITEATPDEIAILNKSLIDPPILTDAKFVQGQDGLHIYPDSITSIELNYVRTPEPPVWGYSVMSGIPVYAAGSSQDFELPDITHLEILMFALQFIGINLSLPEVTQYAMNKEQEGI